MRASEEDSLWRTLTAELSSYSPPPQESVAKFLRSSYYKRELIVSKCLTSCGLYACNQQTVYSCLWNLPWFLSAKFLVAWLQDLGACVPGAWFLVPCSQCLVPGALFLVAGSWRTVPGSRFLKPGSWSQVSRVWFLDPVCSSSKNYGDVMFTLCRTDNKSLEELYSSPSATQKGLRGDKIRVRIPQQPRVNILVRVHMYYVIVQSSEDPWLLNL